MLAGGLGRTPFALLAQASELPRHDERYGFEVKWDGVRAICFVQGGRIRLQGRKQVDCTAQYPELRTLGEEMGAQEAVLDGEVVALDGEGRPSFQQLQYRMNLTRESDVRRRMREIPVTYMIFDLLYLDGHSTMGLAYSDRRRLLEALELSGPHWRTPAYHAGDGEAMLAASRQQGLEGVVAKRLDSAYLPGKRSTAWLKVKNQLSQEFVIGGWTPGEGNREGTLGALLVGYYEEREGSEPELRFAGRVGTGFSDAFLRTLQAKLEGIEQQACPFVNTATIPKGSRFARPELVGEVEFTEWTRDGTLRHPSFKGLRDDKAPRDVTREYIAHSPDDA